MPPATSAHLIRIARLRRYVGVFARGGDVESAAEALLALSKASRDGGLVGESLKRARQAAEMLAETDRSTTGVRSLLHLSSMLLASDVDAAASAADVARERAAALEEPARGELVGLASLVAGVAHGLRGDDDQARARLDEARDQLVTAGHPEGAAIALTQHGLLDAASEQWDAAEVCWRFARDFYVAARQPIAAAEVSALAARTFASDRRDETATWYRTALDDSDTGRAHTLGAELAVEYTEYVARDGTTAEVTATAEDAARRCSLVTDSAVARPLIARTRMQLARIATDAAETFRHVEAAFEIALDLRDAPALAQALELVVTGLVDRKYGAVGWRVVSRFHERLAAAGLSALAETAQTALHELYPLVSEEIEAEEREAANKREAPPEPVQDDEPADDDVTT